MNREWLKLESTRFTTPAAFVREIFHLLDVTDYGLELLIKAEDRERLDAELEGVRALGRLAVRII
jgi:hypothetical protein